MILQIDVTVTGPDSVLTGSTAVTVNPPAMAEAHLTAAVPGGPPGEPAVPDQSPNVQVQQYSQAMRWAQR